MTFSSTPIASAALAAVVVSIGLIAAARRWARRRRLLDHPSDRSLHVRPTPRVGGIGIVVPLLVGLGFVPILWPQDGLAAAVIGTAGGLIAVFGLADDVYRLAPATRLVPQIVAALSITTAFGGLDVIVVPGIGRLELGWLSLPSTIIVIVGLTNAYNFMDGIDGIAGSQAGLAGLGWVASGYAIGEPLLAMVGALLGSASVGFLIFNWPPASIFLGDVGSAFVGFVLAALTVFIGSRSPEAGTAGLLFVWPFIFDAGFTLVRRAILRENVLRAHRSHLYQRLVLSGLQHRTVTLIYAALAAAGVGAGLMLLRPNQRGATAGVATLLILAGALWLLVAYRERRFSSGLTDRRAAAPQERRS
jgi:UDP-N-acetylmuramyl pentapeptide phosphotransferase/UDP-N-acetylglucosamine-1-phosphate transferase